MYLKKRYWSSGVQCVECRVQPVSTSWRTLMYTTGPQGDDVFSQLTDWLTVNKQSQLTTSLRGHLSPHLLNSSLSEACLVIPSQVQMSTHLSSDCLALTVKHLLQNKTSLIGWECLFLLSDLLRVSPSDLVALENFLCSCEIQYLWMSSSFYNSY